MKHLFYFMVFLAIWWEVISLVNLKRVHKFYKTFKAKDWGDCDTTQKTFSVLMIGYWLWTMIGLFTFQWPIFLMLIIMRLVPKSWMPIRFIDALISVVLLLFIVLNKYHFHIDVFEYIQKMF